MSRWIHIFFSALYIIVFCSCADASQTLTFSLETPKLSSSAHTRQSRTKRSTASSAKKTSKKIKIGHVGVVTARSEYIYKSRSNASRRLTLVKKNTPLAIVDEADGWYAIVLNNGSIGWMPVKSVALTEYDLVAKKSYVDRGILFSRNGQFDRYSTASNDLVQSACQFSVARYLFGGTDPARGMDCSAFVRLIFSKYGTHLPRTAREQAKVGANVPFDKLQPGDRLYFACRNPRIDHCGIYIGNGRFVHCSASRNGVGIDSLASDFFWRSLVVARRS